MTVFKSAVLASVLALISLPVHAFSINFVHEGSGSGSIGGASFGASAFVITATADTANRQDIPLGIGGFFLEHLTASISISGMGVFEFITPTQTFLNTDLDLVGFMRTNFGPGSDLFNGPSGADFSGWDLISSIGPIAGSGRLQQWADSDVLTSGGVLAFADGTSDARFQATTGLPEPGTLSLFIIGLFGIAWIRRRKSV